LGFSVQRPSRKVDITLLRVRVQHSVFSLRM